MNHVIENQKIKTGFIPIKIICTYESGLLLGRLLKIDVYQ